MTEQTSQSADGAQRASLDNQFDHAMAILLEAQRTINNTGTNPAALASALCASYVTYVAAIVAATGMPKEQVIDTCKEAIDTMGEFVNVAYDRMVKEIAEAAQ